MVKQTKRQRKFLASGGVKTKVQKRGIAKKSKIHKRKRNDGDAATQTNDSNARVSKQRSDDFVGSNNDNLAGLELDDFFIQASKTLEAEGDDDEVINSEGIPQTRNETSVRTTDRESDPRQKREESGEDSDDSSEIEEDRHGLIENGKEITRKNKLTETSSSSDSDGESDGDDIEAAERRMQDEMAKLTRSDPEFHEFLQENESSLLNFGNDSVVDENLNDDEQNDQNLLCIHLTMKEIEKLEEGVFKSHGIKNLKRLMAAYRSACHLADSADEKARHPGESGIQYIIDCSTVFDKIMVLCLKEVHEVFKFHLFGDKDAKNTNREKTGEGIIEDQQESDDAFDATKPIDPKKFESSERWSDMIRILQSFFASSLHIMATAKEPELLAFILKALSNYMVFLTPFPRLAEAMLKMLVEKWSAPLDSSEDYQVVRLISFFRIRQLARTQPFPFIETCLRKTYLAYASRAKLGKSTPTDEVLSTLTFMGNSVVELYSLDPHSSYQHAFVYIRQLALHLRSAVRKSTGESLQQIFSWQYIHCLKLWVAVLSDLVSHEDAALMRSLIYPLAEVISGVERLAPSNLRYLPFRLHCVRFIQQLAASSESFMPTASLLLDCFDWKEWYLKPKKTSKKDTVSGFDLFRMLKLPKEDSLRTHERLEIVINEIFILLNREINLYIYTPGFPEYCIWIRRRLKTFNREIRQQRWRRFSEGIIDTCEKYSKAAVIGRSKIQEAPKDVKQLECLLPSSVPSMKERHKAAVDNEARRLVAHIASSANLSMKSKQVGISGGETISNEDSADNKPEKDVKRPVADKSPSIYLPNTKKAPGNSDPKMLDEEDEVQEGINWSDDEND